MTETRQIKAPDDLNQGRFNAQARARWPDRIVALVAVVVLHAVVLLALLKGLAATGVIADPFAGTQAYNVPLQPPPTPSASPTALGDEAAGKAGAPAPRAKPREVSAPVARVPAKTQPAPPAASTGTENRSGAGEAGGGTGAGGAGGGIGSGGSGEGTGSGGGARKVEKIAGDIRSTRDYPAAARDARLGRSVIIAVTVGTDGRPRACRIARPSGNAEADEITCRLAMERFRFRPATDRDGNPVEAVYGWQQRWFTP